MGRPFTTENLFARKSLDMCTTLPTFATELQWNDLIIITAATSKAFLGVLLLAMTYPKNTSAGYLSGHS